MRNNRPNSCHYFQIGRCSKSESQCGFKHSPNPPLGYCPNGRNCAVKHCTIDCASFSKTFECPKENCEYRHDWAKKFEKENNSELEKNLKEVFDDFQILKPYQEKIIQKTSLDLMFIMDCTGSMSCWMQSSKNELKNIIECVCREHEGTKIRISFVGYRDFCDGKDQFCVKNFTESPEEIISFISSQQATGGGDFPEDVAGGLELALSQNWSSVAKYAIFVADAPGHGTDYHDLGSGDDYPKGDPKGRKIEDLVQGIARAGIDLYAIKINSMTSKMFEKMSSAYSKVRGVEMEIANLGDSTDSFGFFVACTVGSTISRTSVMADVKDLRKFLTQLKQKKNIEEQQNKEEMKGASEICESEVIEVEWDKEIGGKKKIEKVDLSEVQQDAPIKVDVKKKDFVPDDWNNLSKKTLPAIARTWFIVKDKNININWRKPLIQSSQITTNVQISFFSFAEGAMRYAFYMKDIDLNQKMVAKIPKEIVPRYYNPETMMKDIESLVICQHIVNEFNDRVVSLVPDTDMLFSFVHCFIYEILDGTFPYKYWWGENFIKGKYEKFNNNSGWLNSKLTNTSLLAQTLSHFSWQFTKGYLMIVDLQGSTGTLTDPQIHCSDSTRFGQGNLGYAGILKFFMSHKCNRYCRDLGLIDPLTAATIPKGFTFFLDTLTKPQYPDDLINKLCDLCRKPYEIKAIYYYNSRLEYPESYCNSCNDNKRKTTKVGKCIDCGEEFRSSEYWFKMKRTDFPIRCQNCRKLNRDKMRMELEKQI